MMKAQPPFPRLNLFAYDRCTPQILHLSQSGSERSAQYSGRRLRRFHNRERAEAAVMTSLSSTSRRPVQAMEDRLSALPEPILLHILSFVPTLDVVRTSVLSTRWRTLWTSVDVLDFDEDDDDFLLFPTGKRKRKSKSKNSFTQFVGKVLSFHHTPTLRKLRLRCCSQDCPLEDWVRTAVSRGVQMLDLRLPWHPDPDGKAGRLPPLLFASRSLVKLRLDLGGSALILPRTPTLVGLRRMRLCCVKFPDDQSTRALFSSSTALSNLTLENCDYRKLGCLEISCSSLQELAITSYSSHYPADGLSSCLVKIAAPQLSSFVYRASVAQSFVVEPLSCVEHVKIQFQCFEARKGLDMVSILDRDSSFLSSLSSARNLDICPVCVEALQLRAIPFHNLNVLTTGVYKHDQYSGFRVVLRLLVSNPRLRALIVHVRNLLYLPPLSAGKEDFLSYLGTWYKHGCGAVERVEVRCSDSACSMKVCSYTTETVLELVKALLGSQANLSKLILSNRLFCVDGGYNSPSSGVGDAVMEKVLSFPRRTRELAVVFI